MITNNCALAGLNSFLPDGTKPWNKQRAVHLFRRAGFGANPLALKSALQGDPVTTAHKMVDDAKALALAPEPIWANWTVSNYSTNQTERANQIVGQITDWTTLWVYEMKRNGLRDRMSWFWHNHFVTKLDSYQCPSWMYQYHKLLQKHALGNFKDFVTEMGLTPAMLVFLNGIQNTKFQPNENFARELLELFTLGVDNGYTQNDVVNTARAVSGWNGLDIQNLCGIVTFVPAFWDSNPKTIFGKTGNWNYQDVINLLFTERPVQISEFICGKLYAHFINPKIDEATVKDLATIFRNNNFEIAPVLKTIFASEHFFDEHNIGTVIPGHLEYFLTFLNEMGYSDEQDLFYAIAIGVNNYDQVIFSPTDVSGWPGNRNWITAGSIPFRTEGVYNIMAYYYQKSDNMLDELRKFSIDIVRESENNPKTVTNAIIEHILPQGLQYEIDYNEALVVFKSNVPENYFESGAWNLNWEYAPVQVFYLINHLANLPEYQLK